MRRSRWPNEQRCWPVLAEMTASNGNGNGHDKANLDMKESRPERPVCPLPNRCPEL